MNFYQSATATSTPKNKGRKFGIKDKLAYAAGDAGCNMSFALNGTITTFYTMYIGLSPELMALIIILLKVWDGINDPIMGAIMDRFRPKPGQSKFKPFIFWGSIALVVSGALVFLPVKGAPLAVKILCCVLGYLVWDTAYTVVNVPYGSMANVITSDPEERAQLSLWRSIGAMIAQLPVMVILPMLMYRPLTDAFGKQVDNPYQPGFQKVDVLKGEVVFFVAIIMGIAGFFFFQLLMRGTVERLSASEEAAPKPQEKVNYLEVIKSFGKNRAAIAMTVASIFQLIMMQGLATASAALYKDFFDMAGMSGIIQLVSFLPLFIVMPLITPLVKKYGKKEASQWPLLLGVIGGALMMIVPKSVFLAEGGIVLWIILQLIVSLSFAVFSTATWAMVADCIDYQEYQTGRREEGSAYAIYSLGRKVAQGLGAAVVLVIMGWLGFQEAGFDKVLGVEIPSIQTPEVANRIRLLIGGVYLVCSLVQFIMIKYVYPLTKEKVAEMNAALGRENNDLIGAQMED